ncbi:hypothetical protein EXN66_Car012959 [Channa argus]|uniref:Uncharacterized protein n=1 Tax=Channa argus TaxID=215402 RepID=A0A6G1Q4B1_CHAAH|nr:hypothetical protein EXN66_Car012959 [Channa argus]
MTVDFEDCIKDSPRFRKEDEDDDDDKQCRHMSCHVEWSWELVINITHSS